MNGMQGRAWIAGLIAGSLVLAGGLAAAQDEGKEPAKSVGRFGEGRRGDVPEGTAEMMTPETDKAIASGLAWLARNQNADGSFGGGTYRGNIAVTSLAGLAFMSSGSSPGRGPYGAPIDRALAYVMDNTAPSGFIAVAGSATHGPMYSHGFGTLFLAEAYGMTHRPEIREKLRKAVQLIIDTQNNEGGWRYQPIKHDADLSVTICQINALRAARNAGLYVPKDTVEACIRYVKQSQNPDGGFRYMLSGGASAFPRSAAGVVALQSAGEYESKEIRDGLAYLRQYTREIKLGSRYSHYFYGHYYAAQAMWIRGGDEWAEKWYPAIRNELVKRQSAAGYWTDSICNEYGTAMALTILQIPEQLLADLPTLAGGSPGGQVAMVVDRLMRSRIGAAARCAMMAGVVLGTIRLAAGQDKDRPKETGGFADARRGDVPEGTAEMMTPETDKAIASGLTWLAHNQNADGSFGSGTYRGNIAVTSLAGLAFMSSGSSPGRGPYGGPIDRALAYVMGNTASSGFISVAGSATHGPMYSHGFGTLFLAEAYGMTHRPEIREKLRKAVQLIINSQNSEGGWRYQPIKHDADLSVTICQINALRAARNAGLYVPKDTVEACIRYVKQSQNPDGGFRYMLSGGPSSEFPRSAAGVVALQSAGEYDSKEVREGISYLQHSNQGLRFGRRNNHYFYGQYYAAQAMWIQGGPAWAEWYPTVREELLKRQSALGYWSDNSVCSEYGTAMALIVLQIPNNYLPIFQR